MVIWIRNLIHFKFWKTNLKEGILVQQIWKRVFWKRIFWSKLKLHRLSSGKHILDSGNIYTTHNQQLQWDALRRWWLNLSPSLPLFFPIFCVLPVSLRDNLYREKDLSGGLCHGRISYFIHPKTLILDRLEHARKWPENLEITFSDAVLMMRVRQARVHLLWWGVWSKYSLWTFCPFQLNSLLKYFRTNILVGDGQEILKKSEVNENIQIF